MDDARIFTSARLAEAAVSLLIVEETCESIRAIFEGESLHIDGCTLAGDHDGPCDAEDNE